MTDQEFWGHLRAALAAEFLHVFESTRIPDTVVEAVIIGPDAETDISVLADGDVNAEFSFRVSVVSNVGWESAMALAPRARACVEALEQIEGVTFIGLERSDYLLSMAEGARPSFSKSMHFRASTTVG